MQVAHFLDRIHLERVLVEVQQQGYLEVRRNKLGCSQPQVVVCLDRQLQPSLVPVEDYLEVPRLQLQVHRAKLVDYSVNHLLPQVAFSALNQINLSKQEDLMD